MNIWFNQNLAQLFDSQRIQFVTTSINEEKKSKNQINDTKSEILKNRQHLSKRKKKKFTLKQWAEEKFVNLLRGENGNEHK